ncbi:MAG: hypothetical protein ACLGIE_07860 [Alphaproteobacteria bacterium]
MNVQVPIKKTNPHGEQYTLYQDMSFVEAVRDGHIEVAGFNDDGQPVVFEKMMWNSIVIGAEHRVVEGLSAHELMAVRALWSTGATGCFVLDAVEVRDV